MMMKPRQFFAEYAAELTFFLFKIAESMLEPTARLFIYDGICLNLFPPPQHHGSFQYYPLQPQQPQQHHQQMRLTSSPIPWSSGFNETGNDHHQQQQQRLESFNGDDVGNDDTCGHLHRYPEREMLVQNAAARYMMYYKILLNFPAMFLVLFCGAMSDMTGRKLPILLTCFGTSLAVVLYMVSVYIGPGGGVPYLPLFLVGAAVRGVFGRSAVMTMAVHSYVSDHSSSECRTQKISNLVAMSHFGYLIGSCGAGVMLDHVGYVWVFLTVGSTQAGCGVAAVLCMEESTTLVVADSVDVIGSDRPPGTPVTARSSGSDDVEAAASDVSGPSDEEKVDEKTPLLIGRHVVVGKSTSVPSLAIDQHGDDKDSIQSSTRTVAFPQLPVGEKTTEMTSAMCGGDVVESSSLTSSSTSSSSVSCLSLFKDSFMVVLRPREGSARCRLITLFLVIYVQQMMKSGEIDILLLYVERTPMNMSKTTYGYFLSVNYMCLGICAFVGPRLLERLFQLSDGAIAVIGVSARVTGLVVLCLSKNVWMVFVAAVVAGPHSLTVSSCKSMISKMIGDGEMGKTFSLLSSGETLANLLGTVVFTNLYAATLTIFAGSTFICEGFVFLMLTVVIVYIGHVQRRLAADSGTNHEKQKRTYTSP